MYICGLCDKNYVLHCLLNFLKMYPSLAGIRLYCWEYYYHSKYFSFSFINQSTSVKVYKSRIFQAMSYLTQSWKVSPSMIRAQDKFFNITDRLRNRLNEGKGKSKVLNPGRFNCLCKDNQRTHTCVLH